MAFPGLDLQASVYNSQERSVPARFIIDKVRPVTSSGVLGLVINQSAYFCGENGGLSELSKHRHFDENLRIHRMCINNLHAAGLLTPGLPSSTPSRTFDPTTPRNPLCQGSTATKPVGIFINLFKIQFAHHQSLLQSGEQNPLPDVDDDHKREKETTMSSNILVLGAGELGTAILEALANHPQRDDAKITVLLRATTINSTSPEKKK